MAHVTGAEAFEVCLARGLRAPDCEALVADRSVNGAYCDGTIVMTVDGTRCVSRELEERVARARDESPLPSAVVDAPTSSGEVAWWPWALGIAALVGVALVLRR